MRQPNPSRGRTAARVAATSALLAAVFCCGAVALAQSGRKAQKPLGLPAEAPKQGDAAAARPAAKKPEALYNFVVMRSDDSNFGIDLSARDGVAAAFVRRLGQASTVEITDAGK
ncbi:MAG TPA: hypothetical protein VF611_21030, partial [Pyrinomonadaceae bacterium]